MEESNMVFVKALCVVAHIYMMAIIAYFVPWLFGLDWNAKPRLRP